MNEAESRPESSVDQNDPSLSHLLDSNLLSLPVLDKKLQKDDMIESKSGMEKELTEVVSMREVDTGEKSCSSKTIECESSDYLFSSFDQNIDISPSLNHKFYGCKRKGLPSPCSESFGLPDDPIYSNSPIFLGRTRKSSLDIDLADPWDISVLGLEYLDQPWLVEYPEVITPYWDIESLFPFEAEDIRQKIEPEHDSSKESTSSGSFNISSCLLDATSEHENDNVFTSTPVKDQNSSLSVVSTISISNGEDNNVNIAVLKDEVLKALEEAIKQKSTISNIDMKIQIVTSDLKSPASSPKKSSVEVRINENVETESCRSTSSSKENYFIENVEESNKIVKSTIHAKELSSITISELNEDWQDSYSSDLAEQSQDELTEGPESSDHTEKRKKRRHKRHNFPGVRRSLRFSNISTKRTNLSSHLSCDSSLNQISTATSKKISENVSEFNENSSETETQTRRILRSSFQVNQSGDSSQNESIVPKIKDFNPSLNQCNNFNKSNNRKKCFRKTHREVNDDTDTVSSQDEDDKKDNSGNKAEAVLDDAQLQIGQGNSANKAVNDKPKRSGRITNVTLPQNGVEISENVDKHMCSSIELKSSAETSISVEKNSEIILEKELIPNKLLTSESQIVYQKTKRKGRSRHKSQSSPDADTSRNNLKNSITEAHELSESNQDEKNSQQRLSGNGRKGRYKNDSECPHDTTKSNLESPPKKISRELLNLGLDIDISMCPNLRGNRERYNSQSSQDESDCNLDIAEKNRKRGRPRKAKAPEINDIRAIEIIPNDCILEKANYTQDDSHYQDEEELSPTKRVLRSSTQNLKAIVNEAKEKRRRTFSSSATEKPSRERNTPFITRKRSVSANFDSRDRTESTSTRRFLRSQASQSLKIVNDLKSPENSDYSSKPFQSLKSSRISFNLGNSLKDPPKKFDPSVKSILKNVYDASGRLIGLKVHKEKITKMPNDLDIKPEDYDNPLKDGFKDLDNGPPELELNVFKNEDEECLRENGITSEIKIVISPLEIKEEDDSIGKTCPVLPLAVPRDVIPAEETTGQISTDQSAIENTSVNVAKPKRNNGKVSTLSLKSTSPGTKEAKDVKAVETVFKLGNFVWAQVGKYPYWPAIVCEDPVSRTFRKEVMNKLKKTRVYYHIRFFGDYGRRAWVFKKYVMLYSSSGDLEKIANRLKTENKTMNIIRPYLPYAVTRRQTKWSRAVEEIESMRKEKYDVIHKHMLDAYVNHIKKRTKRKFQTLDASSGSESEDTIVSDENPRKKLKTSEEKDTADNAKPVANAVQSKTLQDFGEINIPSVAAESAPVNIVERPAQSIELESNTSNKLAGKRARRSVKAPETVNSTPTPSLNSDQSESTKILKERVSDITPNVDDLDRATPRRSRRSLKPIESFNIAIASFNPSPRAKSVDPCLEGRIAERKSLRVFKTNEASTSQSTEPEKVPIKLGKMQPDEGSEADSKSTSTDSNLYSFEYQMELHKKNSLFNGMRNVKVCDYCLEPGDLYKCKGKCGGFFHLDCASKVTKRRDEKKVKKMDKSPSKARSRSAAPSIDSTPRSVTNGERCRTRNQGHVQIITIKSKHAIGTPKKVNLPDNFDELSLSEQIDYGMKEMMSKFENRTVYLDSTDSSSEEGSIIASKNKQLGMLDSPSSSMVVESEKSATKSSDLEENGDEEKSSEDLEVSTLSENAEKSKLMKHVTADSEVLTEPETPMDINNVKCTYCRLEIDPPCFACGLEVSRRGSSIRQKCSQYRCGRYYHPHCLKMWPQTQWSIGKWSRNQEPEDSFTCPTHTCHTCFSEELGSSACRIPGDKLARCMLCPAGFHTTTFCIPAGTEILGGSQIVCPRHRARPIQPINTIWCFICSEGGNLVCCDTCPTSVHPECQPINLTDDDKYICEDCESGRFPLYDEIVWVKLGQYRWWPAIVLFPNEIPENVRALKHQRGDFAVRFFGTNDHYWVNKARSFLFQEGDRGGSPGEGNKSKNKVYETFGKAIEDAALAYKLKKEFKLRREAESISSLKPPAYVRINKNKPVGNVKSLELDLSNATACECDSKQPYPCGPDSCCINRLLMTECDPNICPAGTRCRNQAFQKRDYPPMIPYKTQGRGWGLRALAPIKKGQFVIEYVGELIDSEEYQRRIQKMHEQKEENYYFMTVDSERMIDAGPKGNLSRFMNHCCNPNCITQKWTVRGDTCVGLFANCDIETGSELTFNYNLEVVGQEKKVCKCGASNCSGFIGVKAKADKPEKPQSIADRSDVTEHRRPRKYNKKRAATPPLVPPCFMCGRKQSDLTCNNKFCNKGYHLRCLKLEDLPEVTKFTCPRHNCNLCSNRTIRCCVKCTNSFCPSHSEGNVRHDKFLGFVCRLHDPVISPLDLTSDRVKEKRNPRITLPRTSSKKSINSYGPEDRERIRAMWRFYNKRRRDKLKAMKLNSRKKAKTRRNKNQKSKIVTKVLDDDVNRKENKCNSNGRSDATIKSESQRQRVEWRESQRRTGLRNKQLFANAQISEVHGEESNISPLHGKLNNKVEKAVKMQESESNGSETVHGNAVSNVDLPEFKDGDASIIQNNSVTSENIVDSNGVSEINENVMSSLGLTSARVKDKRKPRRPLPKTSGTRSINSYGPEERERIRAMWRVYNKRRSDKQKAMKLGSKEKTKAVRNNNKKKQNVPKALDNPLKNNEANRKMTCNSKGRSSAKTKRESQRQILRDKWRESQRRSRLRKKQLVSNAQHPEEHGEESKKEPIISESNRLQDGLNNKNEEEANIQENNSNIIEDKESETIQENVVSNAQMPHLPEIKDSDSSTIQNNSVSSENIVDTNEVSDISENVRSEFESIKLAKRRRLKADSTDESTVSSTTSDEESVSKTSSSHKPSQKETPNIHEKSTEKDETVSSTPRKEPSADPKDDYVDVNKSDNELNLEKRRKRRSEVRNPRKKIKVNVKSLVSTAKNS